MSSATRTALAVCAVFAAACDQGPKLDKDGKPITVGTFRVRTYPTGAKIWSGGELKAIHTPATLVLEEGEYHLVIRLEGAEAYETDITVEAGVAKERIYRIPKPPPSKITVLSDVTGADVRINGYRRGATPVRGVVTKPGPIDITVTTRDGRARSVRGRLKIAEHKTVRVRFTETATATPASQPATTAKTNKAPRADAGPAPRGLLTLGLQPNGVVLTKQGALLGVTPIVKKPMEPGEYELLLRTKDGSKERHVRLTVEPGKHAVYRFLLKQRDEVPEGRRAPMRISSDDGAKTSSAGASR